MAVEDVSTTSREMLLTHAMNGAQNLSNGHGFVSESLRMHHMRTMGMADAIAAQEVRTSGVAREVLQVRATADQPASK